MAKSDAHNELTNMFVHAVAGRVIREGGDDAAVMTVAESILLGAVLLCEQVFGVSRAASVERLNSLTQAVEERLAGTDKAGR